MASIKNLFNRATQSIVEAFNGPRTRDAEFDAKLEQMRASERGLNSLRALFFHAETNISGLKMHFKELYSSVRTVYEHNSPYSKITNEICDLHQELEQLCSNFVLHNKIDQKC